MTHALLTALLLGACTDKTVDTAGPDTSSPDTTLTTMVGDIDATVSEVITTVVTVTWSTDQPVSSYVEFGATDAFGLATPADAPATTHTAVLVGLPAETDAAYRIVVEPDTGTEVTETLTVSTGVIPGDIPPLSTVGEGNDVFMALPLIGSITAPVMVDPDGNIVWYFIEDTDLDVYRVRPSVDGRSVLYNAARISGEPAEDSAIVRVSLDGTEVERISVPLLAHDFVEHADGTIGALGFEYRKEGDERILGNRLIEIAPDGAQSTVWTSWDCFDPSVDYGDDSDYGWTFANALDYDDDEQAYFVGMRNFSSITRVDRATGACGWVFGLTGGTVDLESGSTPFLHEHQFQVGDDTLLVFDNDGSNGTVSRAVEYQVDWQAGTASEIWSYIADPTIYSFVLGDVDRRDNGDTLVTWSVSGQVDRVSSNGDLLWQMNTGLGYAFGFNTVLDSPGL